MGVVTGMVDWADMSETVIAEALSVTAALSSVASVADLVKVIHPFRDRCVEFATGPPTGIIEDAGVMCSEKTKSVITSIGASIDKAAKKLLSGVAGEEAEESEGDGDGQDGKEEEEEEE